MWNGDLDLSNTASLFSWSPSQLYSMEQQRKTKCDKRVKRKYRVYKKGGSNRSKNKVVINQ